MDLFTTTSPENTNLLPSDGTVIYYGPVLSIAEANFYLNTFLETIEWKNDEAVIFGKRIITKRKVAWYGDTTFSYTYSKTTKEALVWTPELLQLKKIIEDTTGETYNSCLLNLYHNGAEGMSWHSDGEKELKKNGAIASVSLGAERKFAFKHKETKEVVSQVLAHGSILVMKEQTQSHWLHRLPPTTRVSTARVNLTFRTINLK
ncbi:alpha-ketoglutarate-dependent dioxygenase AlkB [Flavobacterium sp.]|uniref:alpha-ketoglutarate-dependent dioxygenase AlkB family protein n=1 Tax=Flavobacterium sp. TaxID=239 RepID=UPI00261BDA77|nr:alpha-ketoglutarate-dependent dioxygenase AlkB [Flavobacterium sp.]MDG2432296.1 alpha-ketoglutarate-dependent dioxygenase AlkB [Flavobacterium sp.]